jgi:hypothetical protein
MADLPAELWQHVAGIDGHAASALASVSKAVHAVATDALREHVPEPIRKLLEKETCVQSELQDALLLSTDKVKEAPYTIRERRSGGQFNVFEAKESVKFLMQLNGGIDGFFTRKQAKEKRALAKRKREDGDVVKSTERKQALIRGLSVLGLTLRSDSSICGEFITRGFHDLPDVLKMMARMHFLHQHTNGAYKRAVDDGVRDRGEYKGYHRGIYSYVAEEVQFEARFQLPVRLPWLADFDTTSAALRAAWKAAAPEEYEKEVKNKALDQRRVQAQAARLAKLNTALQAAGKAPIASVSDGRMLAHVGDFFELKLTAKTKVADVVAGVV